MQLFSRKKREKRNYLRKYFADTENCRTFASQSRNKGLHKQDNPKLYYCISFFDLLMLA